MKDDILNQIEIDLIAYLAKPIEELYYHVDKEYDEYSLSEFLILYKMQRLFELNAISKKEYDELRELFETRKKLLKHLAEEVYNKMVNSMCSTNNEKSSSEIINSLREKIFGINSILRSYHLDGNINLGNIIDSCIRNESYECHDVEVLKAFYIKTKKK